MVDVAQLHDVLVLLEVCINLYFMLMQVNGIDVKPQIELYTPDYSLYHNLTAIETELTKISQKYPHYVEINWDYLSRENRPQLLIRFSNLTANKRNLKRKKLNILFAYGEHAREFIPVESMLYLLHNLTQGISAKKGSFSEVLSKNILSKIDLYIISMSNPDGRAYLEKMENYCWRGTRTGVDLDRNFDWEFGKKGSSAVKTDEEYRGTHAFSEPESKVFTKISHSIKFDAFVSFHSGMRRIYAPYADTKSKLTKRRPSNIDEILELAKQLSQCTVHKYKYGHASTLDNYAADGTIFDFMAGNRKVPFSIVVELWGEAEKHKGKSCFDIFNPPSATLKVSLAEIHPLYITLFTYLIDWKLRIHGTLTGAQSQNGKGSTAALISSITRRKLSREFLPVNTQTGMPYPVLTYILLAMTFVLVLIVIQRTISFFTRCQPRRRLISLKTLNAFSL